MPEPEIWFFRNDVSTRLLRGEGPREVSSPSALVLVESDPDLSGLVTGQRALSCLTKVPYYMVNKAQA